MTPKTIARILLMGIGLLILAGLFSCTTPKKKVEKTFNKHPKESKQECVVRYPVLPNTIVEIRYKEGRVDTLYKHDTTRVDCDTIKPDSNGKKVFKCPPCPPSTRQVDTLFIDTSKTIIDTRLVELKSDTIANLRLINNNQDKKIAKLKINKANLISYLVVSITLLIASIAFTLKKLFL
jgi:hypothetical protein